jgi:predicted MFS family arabinose efflux permease
MLSLGTASALGLARFAYGLLLPAMRDDMHWSLVQAGSLTFANGLGYVAGAATAAACIRRWNQAATFRTGMLLIAVSLAANALPSYPALFTARAVAGFAGALVFISGGVIAAELVASGRLTSPITIYFSGTGAGIIASAVTIPPSLARTADSWQAGWVTLAALAVLAAIISWPAAGSTDDVGAVALHGPRRVAVLRPIAVAYVLFALGYIAYITFLSAVLLEKRAPTWQVVVTWTVVGLGVIASPALWSRAIHTWPRAMALGTILGLLAIASAVPLLNASSGIVLASAALYGLTFMAVPAAVTSLIRSRTPPDAWAATLAAFTILFAVGQTLGPLAAGYVADRSSAAATLAWTAILCAMAAGVAMTHEWRAR